MCNFVKAFCVGAIVFIILLRVFLFCSAMINVFQLGNDASFTDLWAFPIEPFLWMTFAILCENGGILIIIGLPFYAHISKFSDFGTLSCIILGILVGAAHQFVHIRIGHSDFYNDRLIYFLGVGAIFGIVLGIVYRFFNRPLTDMQKVNWQIYN